MKDNEKFKLKNERRKAGKGGYEHRDARHARQLISGQDHEGGVTFGAFGNLSVNAFNKLAIGTSHPGR